MMTFITEDGKRYMYEKHHNVETERPIMAVYEMVQDHTLITFNGWRYDMVMLSAAVHGFNNNTLKEINNRIIVDNKFSWDIEREYNFKVLQIDTIDIIQLCPLYASLKLYGARIGSKKLWELPVHPAALITKSMIPNMRDYCYNDCVVTLDLFNLLAPQIALRVDLGRHYDLDLRSKSDAQIAEAVIRNEYQIRKKQTLYKPEHIPKEISYTAPEWIKFNTPELQQLLLDVQTTYEIKHANGQPVVPDWMKKPLVNIGGKKYKVGLGGLHSVDKPGSFYSNPGQLIVDVDVTSYYPRIILNNRYYPNHVGDVFLDIYGDIVDQRVAAKEKGDKVTADALKITINGTFGKLGSKYSYIYSPNLMIQVTITGQLALLMLIEQFAMAGIQVLSANTDGVTIIHSPADDITKDVEHWEDRTGFDMEYTYYDSIHYRDVNNYIAVTGDGKVKTKGTYKLSDLSKNPVSDICNRAVQDYITKGVPVEETILDCKEVPMFLTVRTVRAGAEKDDEYVGKAIRWYYSTDTETAIHYQSNGNKVANSQNGMPMMDMLEELPDDLDYNYYINEANEMLTKMKVFL